TPDVILAGMVDFADHSGVCRGNDGKGDTLFGRGVFSKPPRLNGKENQHKNEGGSYLYIVNGVPTTRMTHISVTPRETISHENMAMCDLYPPHGFAHTGRASADGCAQSEDGS